MAFNLDDEQSAAYYEDANVVVSAGAGSGKTTVLSERYVRLITEKNLDSSDVLTLTFTRKAASEMYERIYRTLSASTHPKALERLAHFDQARIATLDSFCAALTRGGSVLFGISHDFRIDDKELIISAEESAIECIMRHRNEELIRSLVATHDFEHVVTNLFVKLALDYSSLAHPGNFGEKAKKQIEFLEKEIKQLIDNINVIREHILNLDSSDKTLNVLRDIQGKISSLFLLQSDFSGDSLAQLLEQVPCLLNIRTPQHSAKILKNSIKAQLRDYIVALKSSCTLLKIVAENLQYRDNIEQLGIILDEYEAMFLEHKRQKGIVSFRDIAELAVEILKEDINLRSFYKKTIKAIMIDEFQDNNNLQKELMYLIAEREDYGTKGIIPSVHDLNPHKLFFVGDEKQSIYRFRGADVSVFKKLCTELPKKLSIQANYRSDPELIYFFNAVFPAIFGEAQEEYEAVFSPMKPKQEQEDSKDLKVEIYLQLKDPSSKEDSENEEEEETTPAYKEAYITAERIVKGVQNNEFKYGDVALLFMKTTYQNEYENIFRRVEIPFTATDPRGIFYEGPANDFYAILRLTLFPKDRVAYATMLRSPFVNLSDDTVVKILLEADISIFNPEPPVDWFSSNEERSRYDHGCTIFNEVAKRIDSESLASLFSYLWYETGYAAMYLYDEQARHNYEYFDYLYSLAVDADQRKVNTITFLDELAPLMQSSEKIIINTELDNENKVHFLTVHKSKGLQFPFVFLVNAGGMITSEKNNTLFYFDKEFGPTANFRSEKEAHNKRIVNYFFHRGKEVAEKQAIAELKRLFYVGATRAEKKLFIIGTRTLINAEKEKLKEYDANQSVEKMVKTPRVDSKGERIHNKSFLDLLAIGLASSNTQSYTVHPISYSESELEQNIYRLKQKIRQLTGSFSDYSAISQQNLELFYRDRTDFLAPRKRIITTPTAFETTYNVGRELKSLEIDPLVATNPELIPHFGTLCHVMIEKCIDITRNNVPLPEDIGWKETRAQFHDFNLKDSELKKLHRTALRLAKDFLKTDIGKYVVCTASNVRTEFSFVLPLFKDSYTILVNGTIDLIYEQNGTCIIVDFKTDRFFQKGSHIVQMSCYRLAARSFSSLPVKIIVIYLREMIEDAINTSVSPDFLASYAIQQSHY
ncbi:MAG: UvrD-helicase domain-containing protein [Treponema sp.]|jgi:ATP-dependent helicase/nuclease subunit A|nr:UvrD-helicase domain-containing protein [Treponema sp.]